jgi:hypothetical protein
VAWVVPPVIVTVVMLLATLVVTAGRAVYWSSSVVRPSASVIAEVGVPPDGWGCRRRAGRW